MKNCLLFFMLLSCSLVSRGQSTCDEAIPAVVGTNSLPATSESYYWYSYTMPSDGKLQITSSSEKFVEIYGNSCDDLQYRGDGYENMSDVAFRSGEEVFIQWYTYAEGDFAWNMSVTPLEMGEDCIKTAIAVSGTNTVPTTSSSYYWYKYIVPNDGKLRITSSTSKNVSVYMGNCSYFYSQTEGQGNIDVPSLNSGDEVLIAWSTWSGGNFEWEVSMTDSEEGDDCSLAATALIGNNSIPINFNQYYWYTYVMPSDGKLQITSNSTENVTVYSNTCDNLFYQADEEGAVKVTSLSEGDKIFIRWQGSDFDWNLSVSPMEVGDDCIMAATATLGSNTALLSPNTLTPYWFKYEIPITADYVISSVGTASNDTYLRVYSDCSQTLIASKDDSHGTLQSELTLSLAENQTIYILWDDTYSPEGFEWTLSTDANIKEDQVISFDALPAKTLADATFELTATASSDLSVSYTSSDETVATVSGSTVTIIGAGTTTITASQAGDDTYNAATLVQQVLTVNKVSQTITVDAIADQLVDASPIAVSASTTSELSLSYSVSGPATIEGNEITLDGKEGTVRVTVSQAGDEYYAAASRSISFFVTDPSLQDQTITFAELPAKKLGDAAFELVASVDSGLPITFSSSDESVATVSGTTVTIVGAGTTTIAARQVGNDTYRAASVARVLTIEGDATQTAIECVAITASITETTNVACSGSANGSLTIAATGGQSPYRYSLDGSTFQEAASFTALDSGNYVITVEDANGCTTTVESTITTPDALLVEGQASPSTRSANSGSITLSVSGGTAPYQYAWSNGATTATVSDLSLGDYSVTVTDASGCTTTASFTVEGVTAIEEEGQPKISVYPNPAANVLYIDIPAGNKAKRATLYNLLGSEVTTMSLTYGRNRVNTQTIKPGSYVLRLNDGSSQRVMIK